MDSNVHRDAFCGRIELLFIVVSTRRPENAPLLRLTLDLIMLKKGSKESLDLPVSPDSLQNVLGSFSGHVPAFHMIPWRLVKKLLSNCADRETRTVLKGPHRSTKSKPPPLDSIKLHQTAQSLKELRIISWEIFENVKRNNLAM